MPRPGPKETDSYGDSPYRKEYSIEGVYGADQIPEGLERNAKGPGDDA
jgi:hypothetical protein